MAKIFHNLVFSRQTTTLENATHDISLWQAECSAVGLLSGTTATSWKACRKKLQREEDDEETVELGG